MSTAIGLEPAPEQATDAGIRLWPCRVGSAIYFIVGGLVMVCIGIALLTDFRGLGKVWDEGLNRQAASMGKLARFPWPHNPYLGPTFRPAVGAFALVVGAAIVLLNLIGLGR